MTALRLLVCSLLFLVSLTTYAQNGGIVRGNVFDKGSGEPIIYGTVLLEGTTIGTDTDLDGFFSLGNVPPGDYNLIASYVGYNSATVPVTVTAGGITYERILLDDSGIQLEGIEISGRKQQATTDVQISTVTVSPSQIKALPSTGGQADLAQYLAVLPGIVSTGDQGGQLYIRGGSPIQNRILLDGMTIFNPFHSIGFFSVFETETIRSADVLTGGFNAEYGGRISAIVDIKTREGNKTRFGGQVSANPFQGKVLVEGPIQKFDPAGGGSSSFLFTAKRSWIDQTSPVLYSYAVDPAIYGNTENPDEVVDALPFSFTDLYGKLSFVSGNGSKFNVFGFNFVDNVDYGGIAELGWTNTGIGTNFSVIPPSSNLVIGGTFAFSNYDIELIEADGDPRTSGISNVTARFNFAYFGRDTEVNYGFNFIGNSTDFRFRNFLGITIEQEDFTTEVSGYVRLKKTIGKLILEPSLRLQFYASQSQFSPEPRLGMKLNASETFRLKFAGGLYSQNLLSSVNERDVVNLFVGFLSGPEERIFLPGTNDVADNRLQTAIHAVGGFEVDLSDNLELNVEGYYKGFTQLINLNRNKLSADDPNFSIETGRATGIDLSLRYDSKDWYIWGTYSLGSVNRDDGEQVYPTVFDRRHNVNFLASYAFGDDNSWEAALRWNLGTGFPFTQTQGFYGGFNFDDGPGTDILTGNPELGILYADERNGGRLPTYHRMDISLKKRIEYGEHGFVEGVASVTNIYNRENIFFFDRVRAERVNQLPILPSLGVTVGF